MNYTLTPPPPPLIFEPNSVSTFLRSQNELRTEHYVTNLPVFLKTVQSLFMLFAWQLTAVIFSIPSYINSYLGWNKCELMYIKKIAVFYNSWDENCLKLFQTSCYNLICIYVYNILEKTAYISSSKYESYYLLKIRTKIK